MLKFLDWYVAKARLPKALLHEEQWLNGLRSLTVAELRIGMQRFSQWPEPIAMTPPMWWHLCKANDAPLDGKRFLTQLTSSTKVTVQRQRPQLEENPDAHS